MRKFRIGVDLDSTMVNLSKEWYGLYNQDYGDDFHEGRALTWAVDKHVKPECGVKIFDYLNRPGLFRGLEPLPGAVNAWNKLKSRGHDLVVITAVAGRGTILHDKEDWCDEHLGVKRKDIIFAHRKDLVKVDVLLDDGPHNISAYRWAWPEAYIGTIAYPYNESVKDDCVRFAGWQNPAEAWTTMTTWIDILAED